MCAEVPTIRDTPYTPQRATTMPLVVNTKFLIYAQRQAPHKGMDRHTLTELISSRPVAYTYYGMHGARDAGCYLAHSQWHAAP